MADCDTLFLKHRKQIYSFLLFNLYYDKELAEDFLHDLYIKIRVAFDAGKYKEKGKFRAWALWVARHMIADYYRDKNRTQIQPVSREEYLFLFTVSKETTPSREEEIMQAERLEWLSGAIIRAVETLDNKQRKTFLLRVLEDKSFKDIVEITGDGQNTELGRFRYAKINIKKRLNEYKIAI